VEEDLNFIQHIKSFFIEQHPPTAKPALSEHSTSNPTSSSYPVVVTATTAPPNNIPNQNDIVDKGKEVKLNSETAGLVVRSNTFIPTELMELDTLEGFRVGSPGDGSNHLDSFPTEASMALCSAGLELLQLQLPPQPPGIYIKLKLLLSFTTFIISFFIIAFIIFIFSLYFTCLLVV